MLTRKLLKGMGLTDEQVDTIIEAHSETVDALKEESKAYKESADKVQTLEEQLKQANETIKNAGKDTYKVKYEAIKEEFETFKSDISQKETLANKKSAYTQLLKTAGISDKRIESILKVTDLDSLQLAEDGKFANAEELTNSIKTEWADFIQTNGVQGVSTAQPPTQGGAKAFTVADIRKMSAAEINANYEAIKESLKTN